MRTFASVQPPPGEGTELQQQVIGLLQDVAKGIRRHLRKTFHHGDFNPAIIGLLRALSREPGLTIAELSRSTGLVKSYVSKTADQLVSEGLVEKRPDPNDQRLVRIFLSQTAEETHARMEHDMESAWMEVVGRIPVSALPVVKRGFEVFVAALKDERGPQDHGEGRSC